MSRIRNLFWKLQNHIRLTAEFFGDQWFDRTRNITTRGELLLPEAGIPAHEIRDSEQYQPARPHHVRAALRAIPVPVACLPAYTYIDIGSGKGRTLFLAAELPFQQALGVEFSATMHQQATANIQRFRSRHQACPSLRSIHANAREFAFPETPLVLYLFNPFGSETMRHVLNNLEHSLDEHARHTIVILLWPQCAPQVAQVRGMRLFQTTARHQIFEAHNPNTP